MGRQYMLRGGLFINEVGTRQVALRGVMFDATAADDGFAVVMA